MGPGVSLPGPSEHQDVGEAVVVVVGVHRVEAAHDPGEARLRGMLDVAALSVRQEELHGVVDAPGGHEQIQPPITVEVFHA